MEIGTSQRLTVHGRQPIVICQRSTVDRRQQIVIVETKRTITAIDGGPLAVDHFCGTLAVDRLTIKKKSSPSSYILIKAVT